MVTSAQSLECFVGHSDELRHGRELQCRFRACPLCGGTGSPLRTAECTGHPLWHEPLPGALEWMRCSRCQHIHTRNYWTEAGLDEVTRTAPVNQSHDLPATVAARRASWTRMVEKVVGMLGGYGTAFGRPDRPMWIDVGSGDGSLLMTAADYGFAAIGLETRAQLVDRTRALGFNAMQRNFMTLRFDVAANVLSMTDVLEQIPEPREALRKAARLLRPGGVLTLSAPDSSSSGWRLMEATHANSYWMELERLHIFSRERLIQLLGEAGFEVAEVAISVRDRAHTELYAVRKASTPILELRSADAICIERRGGMGDILMALGAAKALKTLSDRPVILATAPGMQKLARSCPHIDHIVEHHTVLADQYPNIKHADLNAVAFGISRVHQIDAYLEAYGVSAAPELKHIELEPEPAAEEKVEKILKCWPARTPGRARVLLHAALGDANRSWPQQRWEELAAKLIGAGHQVIVVGSTHDPLKPAAVPSTPGILSAVDILDVAATVALMRRSDLFVSTDSGPVQLAAATDIAIVGLYSSVAGSCRLPFRHGQAGWRAVAVGPSCAFHPCYQQMHNSEVIAPFMAKLQAQTLTVNEMFANWCLDGGSFACMKHQITVTMVLNAIESLAIPALGQQDAYEPV
jgi:ADP-heptose:LPS heptosyltransferase/SAM-dependent methyltransferase